MGQINQGNQAEQDVTGKLKQSAADASNQGREDYFMDIDRMVNEGLGGGNVTINNGLIEETTTDTMNNSESVSQNNGRSSLES